MKFAVIPTLLALLAVAHGKALAQAGAIGFRNDVKAGIVVQGGSHVNNMLRRGQPILLSPGAVGWDNNVPSGVRFITVYDANQPTRVLLHNFPVRCQEHDVFFSVRPGPRGVILVSEPSR